MNRTVPSRQPDGRACVAGAIRPLPLDPIRVPSVGRHPFSSSGGPSHVAAPGRDGTAAVARSDRGGS